jgi:hypothetical protein
MLALASMALAFFPAFISMPARTLPAAGSGSPVRKVLVIGIDGLRADAFRRVPTPNLHRLADSGAFTEHAVTDVKAWSGPGWSSVLTGAWSFKHGTRDNAFGGYKPAAFPSFLERAQRARPGLTCGAVLNWTPLGTHLIGPAAPWVAPGGDDAVASETSRRIRQGAPDILFVHFDGPDHAGHRFGFSPAVPFYRWAVEAIDARIGSLVEAIRARTGEDWLIVVTSDHGGHGRTHGANIPSDRQVILIANGPGCARERPSGFRGVVDVAPTVFAFLGLPVDPGWEWDGRPLGFRALDAYRDPIFAAAPAARIAPSAPTSPTRGQSQ